MPGVISAGFISGDLPLTGYSAPAEVTVPDRKQRFERGDRVQVRLVSPGYADAVGTRLVRGRYLTQDDVEKALPVVVLNEEAAARYFGGAEAIGSTMTIERGYAALATVVGVVQDVRLFGPESDVRPEAYLPAAQAKYLGGALAIRTTGDPLAIADAVRGAIRASLPEISDPEAVPMSSLFGELIAQRRFNMVVMILFGVVALAIAGAGLYGVMSYLVTQRTREFGVRLALGAAPSRMMQNVVARAGIHTAIGVAIGVGAAALLASSIEQFLFHVRPHDPFVYVGAVALLAACGLVAAIVPARRAARVDPVIALRVE
jgi:predicted permease